MSGDSPRAEISFESLLAELKENTSYGYDKLLSDVRPYESDVELARAIGDLVYFGGSYGDCPPQYTIVALRTTCTLLGMIEEKVRYDKDWVQEL